MILVAIGANLPARDGSPALATCRGAAAALDALPGLRLRGLSRWWLTAPIPASDQPDFVNGVALLGGESDPAALLAALHALEARSGRVRGEPNAARTLDLDLIAIDGVIRIGLDPILPHPRMHERAFVLGPLLDVAPDWIHPRLHRTAASLLVGLGPQAARPL